MASIDYSGYTAQAVAAGSKSGKAQGNIARRRQEEERKQKLEERYAQMAQNRRAQELEVAKTRRTEAVQAQAAEATEFNEYYTNGWVDENTNMYKDKYFKDKVLKEYMEGAGKGATVEQRRDYLNSDEYKKSVNDMREPHAQYKTRQYKPGTADAEYAANRKKADANYERDANRKAYSRGLDGALERFVDKGSEFVGDKISGALGTKEAPTTTQAPAVDPKVGKRFGADAPAVEFDEVKLGVAEEPNEVKNLQTVYTKQNGEYVPVTMGVDSKGNTVMATGDGYQPLDNFIPVDAYNKTLEGSKRTNLERVNVYGQDGMFWHDKNTNQIMGPKTNGEWTDAGDSQMLPFDRDTFTMSYTDEETGEEMTGTFIETFPNDPEHAYYQAGKWYNLVDNPILARGKQDRHTKPTLTKAQNQDLIQRNSATKVMALSQNILDDAFQSNPLGWMAGRMSTITDVFSAILPDALTGNAVEDMDTIMTYIKDNTSEDAREELGAFDSRAIAEGDVVVASKLLSYSLALFSNKGGRITDRVIKDAEEMSESWLKGTARDRGKKVSIINQAAKDYARVANRDLSQPMDNPIWDHYPTAKAKVAKGWELVTDKADAHDIRRRLNELKAKDETAWRQSLNSLEGTLASEKTLDNPVFWSPTFETMVAIYAMEDPATGAIKFMTTKLE